MKQTDIWVLFDLDGTLTQSEEGIWNSVKHTAARMGYPEPDADMLRKFIGPPLIWSFRELMGMGPEEAEEAQRIYRERYNTIGLFENRVYPGVRCALRTMRRAGIHLGIVTGKPAGPTERILEHFGLRRWMECVVCATDGHAEKDQARSGNHLRQAPYGRTRRPSLCGFARCAMPRGGVALGERISRFGKR